MKRILVALAMFPLVAHAEELSAGTFEVSGDSNLGFKTGSVKSNGGGSIDTTDFGLSATGLYYATQNVGVGLSFSYGNSSQKEAGIEQGVSTFLLGPAIGLDFAVAPQFSIFGRGKLGYASSTFSGTGVSDLTASGFGFGLGAGVKYFPTRTLSFDAGIAYDWTKIEHDSSSVTTSGFGFNLGISVYLGAK